MSFFAEELVTEPDIWELVPMGERQQSAAPPDGAHYQEMAHGLRVLARQCRFPGARKEILQLAASYDRRADHFASRAR
jgi:hypothetical protein